MITERDLQGAIAECLGERNPNANTCIKLAAYYTIQKELYQKDEPVFDDGMSFDPKPISVESNSEFANAVNNASPELVWSVMDELMETLQVLHPKLYDGVMRRLAE